MSLALLKKVILSLLTIGLLGTVAAKGTNASVRGESTNARNSVATATLTFSNAVGAGSACGSETNATPNNNKKTCDVLISGGTLRYPGDVITTKVKIKDTGSIDGLALELSIPSGTTTVTSGAGAYANGGDPITGICNTGTSDPCSSGGLEMYVQETASDQTTPLTNGCLFPGPDNGTDATDCLATNGGTTSPWLEDSVPGLIALPCWDLGRGPSAQQTRYFTIGVRLPDNADNRLQGETGSFTLAWHVVGGDPKYTSGCGND